MVKASAELEVGSEIERYVEVTALKRDVGATVYRRLVVRSDC